MTSNPKSATSVVECLERYPEVDRRSGISIREFNREYRSHRKPVVITDAIDDWKARTAWTFDFFKSKFGSSNWALLGAHPELAADYGFPKLFLTGSVCCPHSCDCGIRASLSVRRVQ